VVASNEEVAIRITAKNAASAALKQAKGDVKDLESATTSLGKSGPPVFQGLQDRVQRFDSALDRMITRGAAGLAALTAGGIAWGLKTAAAMEQSEVAFTGMLGSASAAKSMMADLTDFAKKTPFELSNLTLATQQLLAYGVAADQVRPTLTALGDAAAQSGRGPEALDAMIRAVGQMQAKGRIQSEELMQLQEAGVATLPILSAGLHKTTAETQALITSGLLTSAQGIPILLAGMEANASGAMERQSHTLMGIWSNFKDSLAISLSKSLTKAMPDIKKELPVLAQALSDAIKELGPQLPGLVDSFVNMAPALIDVMQGFVGLVGAVAPMVTNVADLLGPTGVKTLLGVLLGYRALKGVIGIVTTFSEALAALRAAQTGAAGVPVPGAPTPAPSPRGGGGLLNSVIPAAQIAWFSHLATRHPDKGAKWYDLTQGVLPDWIPEPHPTTWLGDIKGTQGKGPDWFNSAGNWTRDKLGMSPINIGSINVHNPTSNVDVANAVRQGIENHMKDRQARGGG